MSPIQNFEQHSRHLIDPDLTIQVRLQMAMEVRDSLEIAHTSEYSNFLKCYFRAFSVILLQITKPQFIDNPEHKLRNIVVEILNRLPHSEVLRPFVQDLLKVAMQVLTTDNEENGLICIRIIFDLLRNFRPSLENEVQPFLDFVCKIYQNFRLTVSHFFENGAVGVVQDVKPMDISTEQALTGTGHTGNGQLNPSTRSFKIVTESPPVVMFLFQLYTRLVQTNVPHLLPLMVAAISVPGPEKVPPHLKTHFIELKGAQVKTVSFLTYLLESCADYIRPHEESICKSIVNLLVTCSDSSRLPLTEFLNRYATLAVDYFLAHLSEPKYFRRFMYIIQSDVGQPLREELARSPQKILESAFPEYLPKPDAAMAPSSPPSALLGAEGHVAPSADSSSLTTLTSSATSDAYFQGLALIKTLVKLIPCWLQNNRLVFDTLVRVWKSPARITRLQNEQELNLVQVKESKWLVKCFLNYLRHEKNEVNVLFDILSIFLFHSRIDYTFLKEFYIIEVAEGYPPDMKKALLLHFLDLFQSKQLGHDHLVVVMQMLILPMLAHAFQNDQSWDVVDTGIIKTIVDKLFNPPEEVSAEYDEPLRIELLQLATLFLKYLRNDLVNHRKELITFGWNHLKREASATKQWAFVNVCHFLEAYQAPENIILQVFVALLKTFQPENKMLVKQALDILMPALPKRLPLGDSRTPIWIRYTKKILVKEGHSIPNLIHIFQLIVRHSDLFYSCRAQFVPQMVNSLSRLGLPSNTTMENRRLAIELAGLVVGWERQRQNKMKVATDSDVSNQITDGFNSGLAGADPKRPVDGSTFPENPSKRVKVEPGLQSLCVMSPGGPSSIPNIETPGPASQPDEEFKPNAAMEEMIINFLIRVASVIEPKDKEASAMYKQALDLLSQALEMWSNANVKFNYLEKLLSTIQPSQSKDPSTALAQGLDVMNKVLEKQPHLFIRNNITQINQILEPCFKFKMLDAGKSLCSLLKMVFDAFPLDAATTPVEVNLLYQRVDELIQKQINAVTAPQTSEDNSTNAISFVLLVINTLAEVHKNIDPQILVRILQRLAHDMGSSAGSHLRQGQRTDPDSAVTSSRQGADISAVISNLKSILKLISEKVMGVTECKKSVIQILNALLSEKATDPSVLLCIVDVIKGLIEGEFSKPGTSAGSNAVLTPKEIVSFFQKLSQVDKQNFSPTSLEEWDRKYLSLPYGTCADFNK